MTLDHARHPSKSQGGRTAAAALLLLILLGLSGSSAGADDSGVVPFESFQVILESNIFSPAGRREQAERSTSFEAPSSEAMEGEHVFLVGALIYGGTAVAFFEGTGLGTASILPRGGMVAGYRLVEIRSDAVSLEKDDERIDLPVGSALQETPGGGWEVVAASPGPGRLASRPGDEAMDESGREDSPSPQVGQSSASSNDDVLRRLMERRRQELEQ